MMGLVLIAFGLIALGKSYFSEEFIEEMLDEDALMEESLEPPPLNMYAVAAILASVGGACITISWRKSLSDEASSNPDR
jgi:hypothetical protein